MNTERPDNDGDDEVVVDQETGAEEQDDSEGEGDTAPAPVSPPTPEENRPARRRSPVLIASVATAVLLVGGGGAYLAASASGSGSDGRTTSGASGDDSPPQLHLDGYGGSGDTVGIAPGEPNPYGGTYEASGTLADGPDSAPVYRAKGEVTKDEVAKLADALGVDGTPVLEGQAWKVGGQDDAGPRLQVDQKAPGAWTFTRYTSGTDNCQSETVCASDPVAPADDPVSEDVAKEAAAPVLKAVGQDDAKIDASQVMGAQRVVNADPVVGGLPTYGWTTGITVNTQGEVVGGSGQLKAPVKTDTYPVLSAAKTLDRMNGTAASDDHRMGIGGCASPVPLKDRLEAPCGESSASPTASGTTITVEKAAFGLALQYVDAEQALVPSWLFQVKAAGAQDSYTVAYPAIDPKYIASATTSTPTEEPSPRPTGPGSDEPTSSPVTRNMTVEAYTTEGNELTVRYTGGVCSEYKASAVEGSDKVTVQVTETSQSDMVCIMIAKVYHQTVQLDEPLGDRTVVGTDGKEIAVEKAGSARLPETSGAR